MSNVDHAEIAKFEALAHRWWDRESGSSRSTTSTRCASSRWIDRRAGCRQEGARHQFAAAASFSEPWPSAAPTSPAST